MARNAGGSAERWGWRPPRCWRGARRRRRTGPGAGPRRHRLRRRQPQERARRRQRAVRKETGKKVAISYAASSALAKQIEQGAPADIFISADLDWMDYVARQEADQARHARQPARQPPRADRAARIKAQPSTIGPGFDLAGSLGDGRLAMADVDGGAGRQIRQGGTGEARRLGQRSRQARAGRERARGAAAGVARRGAARHRLRDRRRGRAEREDRRHLPGRHASADHLSGGADGDCQASGRRALSRIPRSASAKPLFETQGFTVLEHRAS